MMARISPRSIARLTRLSATSAPKRTLTPSTSRSGPGARPVPDRGEIDVDQRRHVRPVRPDAHGLLDVGRELELVLEVLRREERAVGQTPHVLGAIDDSQVAGVVDEARVARAHPAVFDGLARRLRILVVALEDAGAPVEDFARRRDLELDAGDGRAHL